MYSQSRSPIETLGRARPSLRLPIHFFLCISLFTLCAAKSAREAGQLPRDLTQLSLEQLMDIEVTTASRKKQKLSETPAAVYVITSDEIRRSTATSIPELLRHVPGLYVARIDANKWAISARGLNGRYANKLLVLVDGRSIYTPLFSGVYWEMQDTLLEDIERIEVIRGPGASMWGGNAVNGVINIITKRAEDTQGGLLTVASGTEQRGLGGIRYGVRISDDAHLRVFGKYTRRDNALLSTGLAAQDRSRGTRGGFRLDLQQSATDQFTVQGDVYDWKGDHMLLLPLTSPPYSSQLGARQAFAGSNVLARWNRVLSSSSNLELQFYFDRSEMDHAGLEEKRDTMDFDFQHRFWLGPFSEAIWGLGYRRSSDDLKSTFVYTFQPDRRHDDFFSAFVQDDLHLFGDSLRLTLGAKFEGVSFGYPDGTPDYEKLTIQPNVRFMWLPRADHAFWGAVSGAVRNPSRADHDMRINAGIIPPFVEVNPGPLPALVTILGNRAFQPERLRAYELGYRAMVTEEFSVDVAGFYNLYDRLREADWEAPYVEPFPQPLHLALPLRLVNELEGSTYGVEVSGLWRLSPRWKSRLGYAFLESCFRQDFNYEQGSPLQFLGVLAEGQSPQNQFLLGSSLDLRNNLQLDADFRWIGDVTEVGRYAELNARLGYRAGESLELSVSGQNLLHSHHLEFSRELFEMPSLVQRGVYGKIDWRF